MRVRPFPQAAKAARQLISLVAKSIVGESAAHTQISFGAIDLEECELLSMHHVQDGYFEAQASARLALAALAASQGGKGDEGDEVPIDEEFEKQVSQVVQSLKLVKKEDKKKQQRKLAKKSNRQGDPESGTEEEGQQADAEYGNDGADEFEEEQAGEQFTPAPAKKSSRAKRQKLQKKAPPTDVGTKQKATQPRRNSKKKKSNGAPPASSDDGHADVEETAESLLCSAGEHMEKDKRIDPEDGLAYTWGEFSAYYTGKYKKKVIEAYWNDCHVVGSQKLQPSEPQKPKPPRRWFSRR